MTASIFKRFSRLLSVIGLTALTGCAIMDKDLPRHAEYPPEEINLAKDIHLAREGWPAARWWTRYNDPQLNALIEQTLANAPPMAMAQARLELSQSQVDFHSAFSNLQVIALGLLNKNLSSGGALINYRVDLWGTQRKALDASIGAHNAQLAESAAVENELSTAVAQTYFSIQSTYQLIEFLKKSRNILKDETESHTARTDTGYDAQVSVNMSRVKLLATEREIVAAEGQVVQLREALRAIVGSGPDGLPTIKPRPLPIARAGLPRPLSYELLSRRPDLQAVRWMVQSSLNKEDAARAAFYPTLDIATLVSVSTINAGVIQGLTKRSGTLIPGVTLPIFDTAKLNAALHGAQANTNMLVEQYNQSVLNAVRNIAVAASSMQTLGQERRLQLEKLSGLRHTQDAAQATYKQGLGSRVAAEEAKILIINEQISLLTLDTRRLNQEILLIKELGGGYKAQSAGESSAQ